MSVVSFEDIEACGWEALDQRVMRLPFIIRYNYWNRITNTPLWRSLITNGGEIVPVLRDARIRMGHKVDEIDPSSKLSFNVLDWYAPEYSPKVGKPWRGI